MAMTISGSYDVSQFGVDTKREKQRLNAQVDLFWEQELALYRRTGIQDGMKVLDCGCGPGHLLEKLLVAFPALQATGIEIDPQLVAVAEQTAALTHPDRCTILQQSIMALELPDSCFDFVFARLVLEHLTEPMAALKEVLRVLKPGGKAIFIDNDFELHERTWPDCPALAELYEAYRRARRADGGNPCIGRELPSLLKGAGYGATELHLLPAHSQLTGDAAFLKAEGVGIPAQLVRNGYLQPDALDRIATQWGAMLNHPEHAIFRMLFAAVGQKVSETPRPGAGSDTVRLHGSGVRAPSLLTEPQSAEEVCRFIQETLAEEMEVTAEALPTGESLVQLGVDSLPALGLCNKLKSRFTINVSIAEVLDGKSISGLAEQVLLLLRTSTGLEKQNTKIPTQPRTRPGTQDPTPPLL